MTKYADTFDAVVLGNGGSLQPLTELVELIERDDEKYPTLQGGAARNPFSFRRDPESEAAILSELGRRDQLPVCAWDIHASPRFDRPFQALREACAVDLGLSVDA